MSDTPTTLADSISREGIAAMMTAGATRLRDNHEMLSTLDAATGDGDHGSTIKKVAETILETLQSEQNSSIQALLESIGWNVMSVDGGSTSPLLGSFFTGMSEAVGEASTLDAAQLASVFESGLAKLQSRTAAKPGDKTMMDAMVPAVEALRLAASQGAGVAQALSQAAQAARAGAEKTKEMQAKFGRARNLGARTIGAMDPGAMSITLMFAGFSKPQGA